ncbi:MAG TPA: neutral zinc metallopeptidase [Gemmatimonadales bacterium]|nr:neutral zinc metallopeptidase [Gemmatimonadales bacterium]
MRWTPGGRSSDLEDRRGSSGGFGGGLGGGGMRIGLGGAAVLLVLSLVFKQNFFALLGGGGVDTGGAAAGPVTASPEEEKQVGFVSFVLDSAQSIWAREFQERGQPYERAKLVLFRDAVQSACGFAQAATGPFYCPGDEKVYIDLGFYDELQRRFGAPGDFAQAYVLAHELGHHVQRLLGTEAKVRAAQERAPDQANELSVRLELQADCYAGVYGFESQRDSILEPGDVEEGLRAAAAVGDDRIQKMQGQAVSPEGFTHGSSEQRMTWFKRGFQSGRLEDCDTFRS